MDSLLSQACYSTSNACMAKTSTKTLSWRWEYTHPIGHTLAHAFASTRWGPQTLWEKDADTSVEPFCSSDVHIVSRRSFTNSELTTTPHTSELSRLPTFHALTRTFVFPHPLWEPNSFGSFGVHGHFFPLNVVVDVVHERPICFAQHHLKSSILDQVFRNFRPQWIEFLEEYTQNISTRQMWLNAIGHCFCCLTNATSANIWTSPSGYTCANLCPMSWFAKEYAGGCLRDPAGDVFGIHKFRHDWLVGATWSGFRRRRPRLPKVATASVRATMVEYTHQYRSVTERLWMYQMFVKKIFRVFVWMQDRTAIALSCNTTSCRPRDDRSKWRSRTRGRHGTGNFRVFVYRLWVWRVTQ